MRYTRSGAVALVVMSVHLVLAALAPGQEVTTKDEQPPSLKKGDEVIALRAAPLQIEAKTVATVRAADKLVVEGAQGDPSVPE
jgi:hypothetical protein